MQARCNRCKYTWRVRVLQTSCRRCPKCRSYDLDYLEWGTPVLPKEHIPHETGDTFIYKRINPRFEKWRYALQNRDYRQASSLSQEVMAMLAQAKRLNPDRMTLSIADSTWSTLTDQTIALTEERTRELQEETRRRKERIRLINNVARY